MTFKPLTKKHNSGSEKTSTFKYLVKNEIDGLSADDALLQLALGVQTCKTIGDIHDLLKDAYLLGSLSQPSGKTNSDSNPRIGSVGDLASGDVRELKTEQYANCESDESKLPKDAPLRRSK